MRKGTTTLEAPPPLPPRERPRLPFDLVKDRGACLVLRFTGVYTHPDGSEKRLPYTHTIGDPNYPAGCSPMGLAVLTLLRLYRELEQHDDAAARQTEALTDRLAQAEAEIATLRAQLQGHESRLAKRGAS